MCQNYLWVGTLFYKFESTKWKAIQIIIITENENFILEPALDMYMLIVCYTVVVGHRGWIYNYMCNQCMSPLSCEFESRSWRGVVDTTLCDKVCQ